MTWRKRLITADVVVVIAIAVADRWLVDSGLGALWQAIIALAPLLAWALAAHKPAWGWCVSGLLLGTLLACMWVSRIVFGHGPAAPPIDWLLPYVAVSVFLCAAAMTVSRSCRLGAVTTLLTLMVAVAVWAAIERGFEGECCMYVPASDAAPLASGLAIADGGETECGQNGALCDRIVTVNAAGGATEIRRVLRSHGWVEDCRPVTGILFTLGLYNYGHRCLSLEDRGPGLVTISVLGKADWWLHNELVPLPHGSWPSTSASPMDE